jgi:NAD(P)-dependent dehydrogenase (short-subunit alcohol dehydrogenase family)
MTMNHAQKLVVVTGGAGGGIGHGISTVLAREGWHVLIVDRDESAATRVAGSLEQEGLKVKPLIADLTADVTPELIVQTSLKWAGCLNAVVNSAGVSVIKPATDITDAEYDHLTSVNLRAMFRISRAAAPQLARWCGSIVNISSVHAVATTEGYSVYSATKAAVVGLTRGLAVDLGSKGIRVNCVLPGLIDGPQTRTLLAGMTDDVDGWIRKFVRTRQLLPHTIGAEEVGDLASFLLSDRAGSITGQPFVIDAGLTATLFDRD